jgi:NodT family efflux transporter outer membrane factor (OMF) lipoprotein
MDLGFNMDWELDFFGKNKYRWAGVLDTARAAAAEAKQSRNTVSSQIAQAYFSLQTHLSSLEIYRQLNELRKKLTKLTELRTKFGLDTQLTIINYQNNVFISEKSIADMEELSQLDRNRLLVLMGHNPDEDWVVEPRFIALEDPLPIPKDISSNFLARRPDLMAAIWKIERAAADIRVAKLEFYPEVNLQGLAMFRSVFPDDLFTISPSSIADSLLPRVILPIFKGGKLSADLKERIAEFDEAAEIYHNTLLHALQEVADLLAQLQSVNSQIRSQKDLYQGTIELRNLTEKKVNVGTTDYIDLLNQELDCLNKNNALLSLQSHQIILAVKLMQGLGGGYYSPDNVPEYFLKKDCNLDEN